LARKTGKKSGKKAGSTAEVLAGRQREISVSEFFAKNRHLLGFDNPRKALLTTVKEAVDNALDACEEAGILPEITVEITEVTPPPSPSKSGRYRVTVTDNGPGIVRKQIENIFGKLLYGSKFHRLKMSRGQQGIGISAAGMYGLMTTGKPMVITTKPGRRKPAHHIELAMDTTKNRPEVTVDVVTDDFPKTSSGTGTRVTIELEGRYQRGKTSVDAYLEQTAIANPHASFTYFPPKRNAESAETDAEDAEKGQGLLAESGHDSLSATPASDSSDSPFHETLVLEDRMVFPRTVDELPPETTEIKPHPYGVELGTFLQLLKSTHEKQLGPFLKNDFCRVTPSVAKKVFDEAATKQHSISGQTWVKSINAGTAERIYKALQESKLRAPPTDCLSPIGVRQLLAGMLKGVRAEFYAASTRSPAVYRGNPFQIEAAIAFGGDLPGEEPARVYRFANRVPLLYQQSACCAFKSVVETNWRSYSLSHPRGALPVGPMVIMIHMASVWVPFTSESKEAIADYDEIRKEMKLALQECGRKLGAYLRKRQKMKREGQRRDVFERYIGEIAKACHEITGTDAEALYEALLRQAKKRTAIADAVLDEEGKVVASADDAGGGFNGDEGVIVVDRDGPGEGGSPAALPPPGPEDSPPARSRRTFGKKAKRKKSGKKQASPAAASRGTKKTRRAATSGPLRRKKKKKKRRGSNAAPAGSETLFG